MVISEPRSRVLLGRTEGDVLVGVGAEALGAAGSLLSMPLEGRKGQRGDILAFLLFLSSALQQVPLPGQTLLAVNW